MNPKVLAYIPARGGSKRVARKNIRELGGVAVLARVLRTLRQLDFVQAACVSTDDAEIAAIATKEGAVTLDLRASKLSDDHTTLVTLISEDLPRFISSCGLTQDSAQILVVLPTAALLRAETLRQAYQAFLNSNTPLLASLRELEFSPARALERDANGLYHPLAPNRLLQRSQDLPPAAIDAGQFYFLRYAAIKSHQGHWFTVPGGIAGMVLAPEEAIDIDTEEDWLNLERVFRAVSLESLS